jgi:hypothetical protein
MGDAKRRKGIEPENSVRPSSQKVRVMKLSKRETVREGFALDLGRAMAADGLDSCNIMAVAQDLHYQALPGQAGIAVQIVPSILSCDPLPSPIWDRYILTIECLSDAPHAAIAEYVTQQLADGASVQVGYDRAYQSEVEYVVPLILEYAA